MKFYRCQIVDKSGVEKEKIYFEKNKKELIKKNFFEEEKLVEILESNFKKKIKEAELKDFYLKVGRLTNAGVSLIKTIEFQKNTCRNLTLKFKIFNLFERLERGEDIYYVLKDEKLIKETELLIIYVCENTGKIGDGFLKIAYLKEKKEKLKKDFKVAISYPLFILFISTIILLLIFYIVVPNFKMLYELNPNNLPILTKIILKIEYILSEYPYTMLLMNCVIFFCIKFFNLKKYILRFSFIKKFLLNKYIISILDNLSLLLEAGVSIDKSIEIILDNIDNTYLKNKMYILRNIKKGETLSQSLKKLNILSNEEMDMIKVGEESGTLEKILKEIASIREENFNKKVKLLLKLIEPILLLIIGIIISIFVIGLYLPILNLNEVLEI
ncbi:type II secretion system F family protein [Candidatus Cetobacterium colombiensis]|uniref:Type II secretion system F family protein n=1 Tax=Candidatus Cetobacterium colombiensis TaxID=3073100 RepID=A0ABU4WE16_9FUSO|nr:type II secretion system F family protein [Candidatus Cetobacterium colombiensis]MDX8336743.1 type II secretion system F family protein [Candidatus Cetobacterium colombiensis]